MFVFFKFASFVLIFSVICTVSANVSQCYFCDSLYCGDSYDVKLGAVTSCSDLYNNAKLYSSKIIMAVANSTTGQDNSEDIETISTEDTNEVIRRRTHAEFFDIKRKIWELFHKGEITANTEYVCVKANYYNSKYSQTKTYRGCLPKYTKTVSTACDFLTKNVLDTSTSTLYGCYTCESNLCNSASSLKNSFIFVLLGTIIKALAF